MARARNKLTVREVASFGPGSYGDGGGLWLRVSPSGSRQWIYRFRLHGKQRQSGLGGVDKVSLAKARQRRDELQAMVVDGLDPVQERRKRKAQAMTEAVTLGEVAAAAFSARQAQLKGDGKAGRWFGPLEIHVLPKLGERAIVGLTQKDIQTTLEPIWHSKAATATKAINRLNIVMQHAVAMGLSVDLQAVAKAKVLLGQQRHAVKHIESMPWVDVASFYESLTRVTPVELALRLLILNPGPRSKPIRFLRLEQIEGNVWTIPGKNMKGMRGATGDWRTILCKESLSLLELAKPLAQNGYLFPNQSGKGVISDASMARLMERRGLSSRPHGFRSSFRTWAAETEKPRDIAELCLAHKIHDKVEASYLRSDQMQQRGELMQWWSDLITRGRLSVMM